MARLVLKVMVFMLLAGLLLAWWAVIAAWYVVMFFLFGLLFPLFRAFRRGDRKDKAEKLRHRETLRAIQHGGVNTASLESERVVIQSPMSFRGAYRRVAKVWRRFFRS